LYQSRDIPGFGTGQRTALFDNDDITRMEIVVFIMRMIFLGQTDDLSIERMLDFPLDQNGHRFVHLVTDHSTGQ
jgi:hypothetical protein